MMWVVEAIRTDLTYKSILNFCGKENGTRFTIIHHKLQDNAKKLAVMDNQKLQKMAFKI